MLRWFLAGLVAVVPVGTSLAEPLSSDALMIVDMEVNGVGKGDAMVIPADDAGQVYWVKEEDFSKLGISLPDLPRQELEGEAFLQLSASEQLQMALDLEQLRLVLHAAPALLGTQKFSLSRSQHADPSASPGWHGYLNYDVSAFDASGSPTTWAGNLAANIATQEWVLRSHHSFASAGREHSHLRLQTYAFRDFETRHLRVSAGDIEASAGFLGIGGPAGGISLEKRYELEPGFVQTPVAAMFGAVEAPSVAEVYVDGSRIRTITLQPGQYEFSDLYYFAGLRDVEIRIRSITGHTESLSIPFYFSDQNLRAGLHEYSYSAGSRRTFDEHGNHYGGHVLAGWHRYGISDDFTLSAQGEHQDGYLSAGLGGTWRLAHLGQMSANYVYSDASGTTGHALFTGWGYSGGRIAVNATLLHQTQDFGAFRREEGISLAGGRLETQVTAGASMGLGPSQTLSLSGSYSRFHDREDDASVSLRYGWSIGRGLNLGATVGERMVRGQAGLEGTITLSYSFGQDWNATARTERTFDSGQNREISISNSIPSGEGTGGALGWEQTRTTETREIFAQHNAAYAIVSGSARQFLADEADTVTAREVRASGSISSVHGEFFLGRPVTGSFAVADVSGLEGVRVYQNNQLVGLTNRAGRLLVPSVGEYSINQLRIDDRDIPMDYTLAGIVQTVVPRSGMAAVANFQAARLSAAGGILVAQGDGGPAPVKSALLQVAGADFAAETSTGPDGDFYLDDIPPGQYSLHASALEFQCDATFDIREEDLPFADLEEIPCAITDTD